jgi:hypothetical protein
LDRANVELPIEKIYESLSNGVNQVGIKGSILSDEFDLWKGNNLRGAAHVAFLFAAIAFVLTLNSGFNEVKLPNGCTVRAVLAKFRTGVRRRLECRVRKYSTGVLGLLGTRMLGRSDIREAGGGW